MTRPHLIVAAVAFVLMGCADRSSFPIIQSRLAGMKGQPIKILLGKLGEPDSKEKVDDGQVYIWDGSDNMSPTFWGNFSGCALKVYVDKSDAITGFFHSGADGACARYAHKLDNSF